jgi:Xaa-Pro dipeptidase
MPTPPATTVPPVVPIDTAERAERAAALFRRLPADVDAVVLFDDQFVQYLTAFVFAPTERPIAAIVTRDGARMLFVPRLEREHAAAVGDADEVVDYPEYPGETHPIDLLTAWLRERGLARRRVGIDHDGYPPVMGYAPRPLSAFVDVVSVSAAVDAQMAIKSEAEVELIRESARWGAVAHRLLHDGTKVGLTEHEVVGAACAEASRQMREAMGPGYRQRNRWISGALAIYRGQIGPESAFPHALAADLRFAAGDTLVTGAGADVWGYLSELERTMFLGTPNAEQRRFFDHMLALQDLSFEAIRPGARGADVDTAHRAYVERHGLWDHWRHHVGHGLGQRIHEAPFLDIGDPTVLEPGMVLSVEPGLYVPGLGGFRHSDTVLVTDDGIEFLTEYPRDLESLTLPV